MRRMLELTRTGVHMSGNKKVVVTKKDLSESVETFKGSVPYSIGHAQNEQLPKLGGVESVALSDDGNTLVGIVDYNELGEEAFEKKLFDDWSVCLKTNPEGKRYLHHLAAEGSVPPAVKGLKVLEVLNLSDASVETVQFPESADDDLIILSSAQTKSDKEKSSMGKTVEELEAELEKQKAANDKLKSDNDVLLSDKKASSEASKTAATERIKKAAEGKIPAGNIADVIALADALPAETIELKDADGKSEKLQPSALLERILGVTRKLVDDTEAIELSDKLPKSMKKDEEIGSLMNCI